MALYTAVSATYEVDVYGTQKVICEAFGDEGLYLVPNRKHDDRPATKHNIALALRAENVVLLSQVGKDGWQYRLDKQVHLL